jgi:hypothetical protein
MGRPPAPLDLEPVDLQPFDVVPPQLPPPRPIPRKVWVTIAVTVLLVWGAIAFVTRDASRHSPPRAPIDTLAAGVVDLGTGRFAAVVGNELDVIERDRPGLYASVPFAPGPITVTGQSGDSLAVQTGDGDAIAFTAPVRSELVPLERPVIAGVDPGQWWMQRSDNALARFDNPAELFPWPAGRAVAATRRGFVVASDDGLLSLVSDYDRIPLEYGTFLASSGSFIAVHSPCSMGSCDVVVRDVVTQHAWDIPMFDPVIAAAIEPTGEHLALATANGETLLVDIERGRILARLESQLVPAPGVPFAWLPGGETLLVAQPGGVAVVRADDGGVVRTIPAPGVQQIFALP